MSSHPHEQVDPTSSKPRRKSPRPDGRAVTHQVTVVSHCDTIADAPAPTMRRLNPTGGLLLVFSVSLPPSPPRGGRRSARTGPTPRVVEDRSDAA